MNVIDEHSKTNITNNQDTASSNTTLAFECDQCGCNVVALYDDLCRRCVIQFGLSCRIGHRNY